MAIKEHLSRKRAYGHGTLDGGSEETDNGFQIERVEFESDYLTMDPKLPVSIVPWARLQKNRKSAGREVNQAAMPLREKSPYS